MQLAKAADVQQSTISRYEASESKAEYSAEHLQALAAALRVSVDFLLTGVERTVAREDRYASLTRVLERFPDRWSPGAVAQIRSYALDGDDPGEEWWIRRLDAITMAVKVAEQSFDLDTLDQEVRRRRGA